MRLGTTARERNEGAEEEKVGFHGHFAAAAEHVGQPLYATVVMVPDGPMHRQMASGQRQSVEQMPVVQEYSQPPPSRGPLEAPALCPKHVPELLPPELPPELLELPPPASARDASRPPSPVVPPLELVAPPEPEAPLALVFPLEFAPELVPPLELAPELALELPLPLEFDVPLESPPEPLTLESSPPSDAAPPLVPHATRWAMKPTKKGARRPGTRMK